MKPLPTPGLLLITDRRLAAPRAVEDVVGTALAAGCRWVSLREKDLAHRERTALLGRLVTLGRAHGATVTVHGDVAAALATGAAGVHLSAGGSPAAARRQLGPSALIGVSAHDLAEARTAAAGGADYVTLGPVFASLSKPGYGMAGVEGLDRLREAAAALAIPVVALGGVTAASAGRCLEAGAAAVAVIGAVIGAADPAAATSGLLAALHRETGRGMMR